MKPPNPLDPSKQVMDSPAARALPVEPPRPDDPAALARARDQVLVERAQRGDEEAFRMLVDLHRDHAYGLALRITRSPADAEDVAQVAFVRAWGALPAFRGESAFGTWLHRIVARRALDRAESLRARSRREAPIEAADSVHAAGAASRDPLVARRLEALMETLAPAQRAVMALFYGSDHSVEEVAGALGMPENTVKTHLARGRAALREAWLRESGGGA